MQATWIRAGFKIARRLRVDTLGWVHLQDEAATDGQEVSRGGLIYANGERKPGYDAFKGG